MGSSVTPSKIRGVLRPDPRVGLATYDHDTSTATQQGPRPGSLDPQQPTSLVLDGLGDMPADTELRIETIRSGMPGLGGATFGWFRSGDDPADLRNWDPPILLTGFQFIDRTTTANRWTHRHQIRLRSGTLLAAAIYDLTTVHVVRRSAGAVTWTDLGSPGATYTATSVLPLPTLVELPNNSVLLLHFRDDPASTGYQLAGWRTTDEGDTWEAIGGNLLATSLSTLTTTPRRLRGVYLDQRISLIAHLEDVVAVEDQLRQWASVDLGARFEEVSEITGGNDGYPDLIVHQGQIYLASIHFDAAATAAAHVPLLRILSSAYDPIEDAEPIWMTSDTDTMEWATRSGGLFTAGELALAGDEDGVLWVLGRDHDSLGAMEITVRRSTDLGQTWAAPGSGPAAHDGVSVVRSEDASTYPKHLAAVCSQGELVVLHSFAASPGTADDSLCVLTLGGYTTSHVTASSDVFPVDDYDRWGWASTWMPYDAPEDTVYTLGTIGAPTITATSSGRRVQTAPLEAARWSVSGFTADLDQGAKIAVELRVASGDGTQIELRISDATPLHYEVHAIVEDGRIRLYDAIAASDIGSVTTTDAVDGQVLIHLELTSSSASCYYCTRTAGQSRDWTRVGFGAPASAAANPGNRLRLSTEALTDVTWRWWGWAWGAWMGRSASGGRAYATTPIYVASGASLQASNGPTYQGETWFWDTAYDYPVDHLDPFEHPSPDVPWRSVVDNVQVDLVWELGDEATDLLGWLGALALLGANIGTAEWWWRNNGGTWAKACDLDLRLGTFLHYTRDGTILLPDTSAGGSLPYYLPRNAAEGMTAKLSATKLRRVARQASGAWTQGSDTLDLRLALEGIDGTEPTSGTGGELWARNYACVMPWVYLATAVKLRIPAQRTADGYYEIGSLLFGDMVLFGRQPSSGRGIEVSPIYDLRERKTGQRSVRRRGRPRRAAELSWTDPQLATDIQRSSPDPVWLESWGSGGSIVPQPVAAPAAVLYDLRGLVAEIGGAEVPVVLLPRVTLPTTSDTVVHITHPEHLLYSRVVTEMLRLDVGWGDEWEDEDLRSGRVRFEEEI